jgi:signal transduction histidine kinase
MLLSRGIDHQALLDGLGQGVLIFDSTNRLILDNLAARTLLGNDLKLIRAEGWSAAAMLFNARIAEAARQVDAVRAAALEDNRPVRFHIYRDGEYIPCWMAAIHGNRGEVYTMVTIEQPDWSALSELIGKFLVETREAVETTRGHADLIAYSLRQPRPGETVEGLGRRIGGFTRIIATHMHRSARLMDFLERLEAIRTGKVREQARQRRRKIALGGFFENFLEELEGIDLIDPETEAQDYRARIKLDVPDDLLLAGSAHHLTTILRDIVRNAIMYSLRATPVTIRASSAEKGSIQINITDEGYGIRNSERERVFQPFQRGRQPQVIGEFGYGVSLFLCKHEIEAMGGRVWFESEEGVGTTFSFKLPAWVDEDTGSVRTIEPSKLST